MGEMMNNGWCLTSVISMRWISMRRWRHRIRSKIRMRRMHRRITSTWRWIRTWSTSMGTWWTWFAWTTWTIMWTTSRTRSRIRTITFRTTRWTRRTTETDWNYTKTNQLNPAVKHNNSTLDSSFNYSFIPSASWSWSWCTSSLSPCISFQ